MRREPPAAHAVAVSVTYRSKRFVLRPEREHGPRGSTSNATVDAALRARPRGQPVQPRARGRRSRRDGAAAGAYSREPLRRFVRRVAKRVDRPARDADIDVRDGKLERTRARAGVDGPAAPQLERGAARIGSPIPPASARSSCRCKVTERPDRTLEDLAKRYPTVIGIDRDAKVLRLYKNLQLERRYKIAVGKAGLETSAGRYKIEEKVVDPPWHAPNKAWAGELAGQTIPPGDPRNPLEARWMGFHDGEGIHGTKDIASLGTPRRTAASGCRRPASSSFTRGEGRHAGVHAVGHLGTATPNDRDSGRAVSGDSPQAWSSSSESARPSVA